MRRCPGPGAADSRGVVFWHGDAEHPVFNRGQTFSCGQTIVDREVTADSRTGQVTITGVGGENTYVQWVLTGTATRLE